MSLNLRDRLVYHYDELILLTYCGKPFKNGFILAYRKDPYILFTTELEDITFMWPYLQTEDNIKRNIWSPISLNDAILKEYITMEKYDELLKFKR